MASTDERPEVVEAAGRILDIARRQWHNGTRVAIVPFRIGAAETNQEELITQTITSLHERGAKVVDIVHFERHGHIYVTKA
jgi:hypothetical protein